MKKLLTLLSLSLLFIVLSKRQSNAQNAVQLPEGFEIGLRLGEINGGAAAIDAVIPFRGNRIRADFGLFDGFSVTGMHDWKFILNENLFWYPGIGALLDFENDFDIAAAAEVGIEYLFPKAPISLSVDWRPTFGLIGGSNNGDFTGDGFGINIRYTFK